ncbi:KamA family radical SAM protein [candidate division KSB1 bacterium RBG_16_48_16]|nr:MAG: KamA family radical SAM protein [candidate division KSB1 bacterium RBG_16_48_16]
MKRLTSYIFAPNPTIQNLLQDAASPKIGREYLIAYCNELVKVLNKDVKKLQSLEWALQMSCINTFRRIISLRSEKLSKFSTISLLWKLVRQQLEKLPPDLSVAFFEEIHHLIKGMRGQSGIYDELRYPQYMDYEGREAAILRSEQLDEMAKKSDSYVKKYLTGLEDEVVQKRIENKKRILKHFKAEEKDWLNYKWHLANVIRNSEQLRSLVQLTQAEIEAIDEAKKFALPFGITPYYVSLMDYEPDRRHDHAIRAQVIPPMNYVAVLAQKADSIDLSCDFMLERATSPVDLVTRRYPNIAILKPYNTCSQICVYCQRNWEIDDVLFPRALASRKKILQAIEWLKAHPSVTEVLVTGGDPLIMNDQRIEFVLSQLAQLKNIERIRIGSRAPVVLPFRITDKLMEVIAKYHQPGRREVALVTHFEHPYEISPESMHAVQQFRTRGMSVYNQTVYTIENSRKFELVALRKYLRLIGVDPYYTFNTKGKEETKSYRVPLARLQQEVKEEARLFPGLVRTDEPVYNVPRLGKNYVRAEQHHHLLSILPDGKRVYEFHPWEKNLSLADSFVDVDVPIYDYLNELERRGENIEDYKTIWYYF